MEYSNYNVFVGLEDKPIHNVSMDEFYKRWTRNCFGCKWKCSQAIGNNLCPCNKCVRNPFAVCGSRDDFKEKNCYERR